MGKKALLVIIPIIFSIIAVIASFQSFSLSQKNLEEANQKVDQASLNLLNVCSDLNNQINSITAQNGPGSDQLNQFIQGQRDNIQSCVTGLQSIKDSCKDHPSMQVCKELQLDELSVDFSRIH